MKYFILMLCDLFIRPLFQLSKSLLVLVCSLFCYDLRQDWLCFRFGFSTCVKEIDEIMSEATNFAFKCGVCGKSFKTNRRLKSHEATHLNGKRYAVTVTLTRALKLRLMSRPFDVYEMEANRV